MADPTTSDGALMIQLAQWGAISHLDEATAAIFAKDFDAESADPRDAHVRKVLMWGETLGTLTKNNLISEELILDWIWVAGLWERVGRAALAARKESGVPQLYENFEALAHKQSD